MQPHAAVTAREALVRRERVFGRRRTRERRAAAAKRDGRAVPLREPADGDGEPRDLHARAAHRRAACVDEVLQRGRVEVVDVDQARAVVCGRRIVRGLADQPVVARRDRKAGAVRRAHAAAARVAGRRRPCATAGRPGRKPTAVPTAVRRRRGSSAGSTSRAPHRPVVGGPRRQNPLHYTIAARNNMVLPY